MAHPLTVLVVRQTLWFTASYANWVITTSLIHNLVRDSETQIMKRGL